MTTQTCIHCELTPNRLRDLLDYDEQTGVFRRRVAAGRHGRLRPGSVVGTLDVSTGYLRTRIDGRLYYLHRLAWLYMTGAWPMALIDHRNGVKSDNSIANLREADSMLNSQNMRRASSRNQSRRLGVWTPKRPGESFQAYIVVKRQRVRLGAFRTADQAHAAYVEAKRRLHEGCSI